MKRLNPTHSCDLEEWRLPSTGDDNNRDRELTSKTGKQNKNWKRVERCKDNIYTSAACTCFKLITPRTVMMADPNGHKSFVYNFRTRPQKLY